MDGVGLPEPNAQANAGQTTRTTCPYCGVGCGVLVTRDDQGATHVKGDPDHPANFGRLCSKGSALAETLATDDRILAPRIGTRSTDWNEALDLVADRFSQTIAEHGPDSVAFYVSGQLLTEDYYVANKLMKGFIGSANIDTNSRLCMASTVAGHRRAFGTDTVPGTYEDLELADLVVLVGSNLAWCHPVLYQRIAAAKQARPEMRVVTIDPRRTATSDIADLHLAIAPDADVALFNRLLVALYEQGAMDTEYLINHVDGFQETLNGASASQPMDIGISEHDLQEFLNLWVRTEKVVTVFSQGVNQSRSGTDKVNAIINCHLASGRIGKPGMGPFSVTGQPNAMGGREVGGLANMLACHLDIENPDHRFAVQNFWDAPTMPDAAGLKAVDMFDAVASGKIKALWIMCTNPAVSMPQADKVRDAIANCDFTVVSDMFATTDTAKLADVILPATGWGEKNGTVTNSERTISRQRPIMPAPGQARHDWDIIADVGRRMGWTDAFDYQHPSEIFDEYAALSGHAAALGRDFDISGLVDLGETGYDALPPSRWPIRAGTTATRMFEDAQFFTPSGKARMVPVSVAVTTPSDNRFTLNTGRVRDQWHTMTRSGLSPRLAAHMAEPYLEMHRQDADALGLTDAGLVQVDSKHGQAILRVLISDRVRVGTVFAPMHWTSEQAASGRINAVVQSDIDPVSGQPASKSARVTLTAFRPAWFGFAVSGTRLTPDTTYWAQSRHTSGWRTELAGTSTPDDWEAYARQILNAPDATASSVIDMAKNTARVALHDEGRLIGALFIDDIPVAVSRNHIADQIGSAAPAILAGRPGADQPDPGPTLCACFNIGVNTILNAIQDQSLLTVEQIGAALGAGTNCGSCRPELSSLLTNIQIKVAAE